MSPRDDLGDPALDPPLTIRVHPDDDPRDPAARRVIKTDLPSSGAPDEPWLVVIGTDLHRGMLLMGNEDVVTWPRQHWLVAATVFRHAEHAARPAAMLDGSDVAATPFRIGER